MWRYSVLLALLLGCTNTGAGEPLDEVIPINTGPFTPSLCTGGSAGEPTCPVNHVEIAFESPLRLTFVLTPLADSAQLSSLYLSGSPVHVENLRLEARCVDCVTYMTVLAASIDVDTSGVALPDAALGWPLRQTHQLSIAGEVIR